jgi:hypothetical protein
VIDEKEKERNGLYVSVAEKSPLKTIEGDVVEDGRSKSGAKLLVIDFTSDAQWNAEGRCDVMVINTYKK